MLAHLRGFDLLVAIEIRKNDALIGDWHHRNAWLVLARHARHSVEVRHEDALPPQRLVIAGASGFVGSALCRELCTDYSIRALSRKARNHTDPWEWQACNLYSLKDCERALQGCDTAIYLVHSMSMPSPLSQATFEDLDLILADNFARAAASTGVRHIIYLSGLLDQAPASERSQHLASRLEVEKTLQAWGCTVTTLRAGLVVGPGGSSLEILTKLVRRLPLMITPRWTDSLTQPIALRDVIRAVRMVLESPQSYRGPFDIGGPEVMSYREMMHRTANAMGVSRPMLRVPFLSPRLSSLWVSLVTGSSQSLVKPLVQSLRHNMTVQANPLQKKLLVQAQSFEASITQSLSRTKEYSGPAARKSSPLKSARSVQRLCLPRSKDAHWVAREYLDWLDRSPFGFLRTQRSSHEISFHLRFSKTSLLNMKYAPDRSFPDRALFYVHDGLLVDKRAPVVCRLEFRESKVGKDIIAAVHDFYPRLPWFVYRYTQAIAHLLVMYLFGRHLRNIDAQGSSPA